MRDLRLSLVVSLFVSGLAACDCEHHDEASSSSHEGAANEGEGTEGEATEGEGGGPAEEGSSEHAERAHAGPIGRTLAVFDDETVTTHLLVIHRVGPGEEDAPADATLLGAAWVGGIERELSIVAQSEVSERAATLFGPVGHCSARILRTLTLRGTAEGQAPTAYAALEVTPCEGTSVESVETTHPFGVEGDVHVATFDSASMIAATEAQSAAVAEVEREAGEGEEMELEAAELSDAHVAVLSGWQSYVVRDGEVLGTYEDGVPASATIDDRTYLMAREGREIRLLVVDEHGLTPVVIDAPAEADAAPAEHEADGADEAEPTP